MPSENSGGSIDKALSVLEALTRFDRVTDIAETTGLPKSTVHRILQSLLARGFARVDGGGGYLPGPRILTLAGRVLTRFDPVRHASAALHELRDATGMTVHFAARDGGEAVYLEKIEGRRPYQMRSRIGMSIPLHTTAIGKAVLAELAGAEVDRMVARTGMYRMTDRSITDLDVLHRQLARVRRLGFAVDDSENDPGINCIAAAVLDHTGAVMGALSVAALSFELDVADPPQEVVAPVARAARLVSLAMGAPPETVAARPGPDLDEASGATATS